MSYLAWLRPEGNLRSAACQRPPPPLQYPPLFPPTPSPPGRGSSSAPRLPCVPRAAPSRFLCCCFRARYSRSCPTRRSCRTGGLTPSCCTAFVCFVVSVRIMRRVYVAFAVALTAFVAVVVGVAVADHPPSLPPRRPPAPSPSSPSVIAREHLPSVRCHRSRLSRSRPRLSPCHTVVWHPPYRLLHTAIGTRVGVITSTVFLTF